MPYTLAELSDRAEIQDVLHRYSQAQDNSRWDYFPTVFAPDAVIELPGLGVGPFSPDDYLAFLQGFGGDRLSGQHRILNTLIGLDGDTAHAVSEVSYFTLHATTTPGVAKKSSGASLYADTFARTPEAWRIARRVIAHKFLSEEEFPYPDGYVAVAQAGVDATWFAQPSLV